MADGFTGKDFGGSSISFGAKEIGGKQYPGQIISDPVTGLPQDLAGLLLEINSRLADIGDTLAVLSPDPASRLRVAVEAFSATIAAITTVSTVTNLGTLATLTTLTNQAQMGGMALNAYVSHISLLSEGDLRRNVVIS